jgi:hypothetical protein
MRIRIRLLPNKGPNLEKVLEYAHIPYIFACHLQIDADPDPAPDPAYHFNADSDPDPTFKFDPLSGSATVVYIS